MSDRYIVFVEVDSHNFRHFLHQQRWAVIRYDRKTGYFETVSSRVLLDLTSTLKPSLPNLFMSSLISLIWLFTLSLCSFTSLIVGITASYFFEKTGFKRVDFLAELLSDIGKKFFCPPLF